MNPGALSASPFETVTRVRRLIHQNPELSNQEIDTTALLRTELERAGLRDIRSIAKTGLVAEVGSSTGPWVAVRADLDALPVEEQTGLAYSSRRRGIMHACGHDAHAAILLGVALAAKRREREIPGTLRLIFQPAEENEPLGARQVVDGGLLDNVTAAVALHVSPDLDVGTVGLCSGPAMACSDEFTIDIAGTGGHAGWPHTGRDAITAAATVIGAMQTIVSRRVDPRSPLVVHVGKVAGGRSGNVIADHVRMEGTIRALRESDRQTARAALTTLVDGICRATGVQGTVKLLPREPVLHNDARVMQAFREAAGETSMKAQVCELGEATMNSEDFAFYSRPSPPAWPGWACAIREQTLLTRCTTPASVSTSARCASASSCCCPRGSASCATMHDRPIPDAASYRRHRASRHPDRTRSHRRHRRTHTPRCPAARSPAAPGQRC